MVENKFLINSLLNMNTDVILIQLKQKNIHIYNHLAECEQHNNKSSK